ncbi:MAG: caspase family protein [Burkholderiales bacterium]|nr:caspase family protein [Burkholderiales bacterium]
MKKALVVGIDFYKHGPALYGCVNDAHGVKAILERNGDGTVNFAVELLAGTGANAAVTRESLRNKVRELFEGDSDIALFYFAGHGHLDETGGYLLGSDSKGDDGVALGDVMTFAAKSHAKNKIIVLDSCHSGIAGAKPTATTMSELTDGMTILTASTDTQYASEKNGSGVFTTLFIDALTGAARNLIGAITPGSVYAYIDQSLGPWQQRPVFKTNVKRFVSLRTVQPPIALGELQKLAELFPIGTSELKLDPTFEPERPTPPDPSIPPPDPVNTVKFAILQNYVRVNLVEPDGAQHMWHAAMGSKACKLTVLGEHYRRLVAEGKI